MRLRGVTNAYDGFGRPVPSSPAASLLHDPLGRLVRTSGGSGGATWFHYDGDNRIAQCSGADTLARRCVQGSGLDELR